MHQLLISSDSIDTMKNTTFRKMHAEIMSEKPEQAPLLAQPDQQTASG